ncbi:MAG: hypothetical protein KA974_08910 [Saprospiraceae bacterium]|nr:hypothetical protein [Saprospiraceae bacterium]
MKNNIFILLLLSFLFSSCGIIGLAIFAGKTISDISANHEEYVFNDYDAKYILSDSIGINFRTKFGHDEYSLNKLLAPGQVFVFDNKDSLISYNSYEENISASKFVTIKSFPPTSNVNLNKFSKDFTILDLYSNLELNYRKINKKINNPKYKLFIFYNENSKNNPFEISPKLIENIDKKRVQIEYNLVLSNITNSKSKK